MCIRDRSSELNLEDELEADLGIDTVKQAEVIAVVRDRFRLDHDPGFRLSQYRTLRDLANYAAQRLGATQPDAIERVLVDTQGNAHRTVDVASKSAPMSSGPLPMDTLSALAEGAARAGLGSGDANQFAASILPAVQGLMESVMAARPVKEVQVPVPTAAAHSVPTPATPNASSTSTAGLMPVSSVVCSGASVGLPGGCLLYTSPSPRDATLSRMPSSA